MLFGGNFIIMSRKIILICICFISFSRGYCQYQDNFKDINNLWLQFYQAFDSLDYPLMAKIHSKNLIRISGGEKISDYQTYIDGYKFRFEKARKNHETSEISLRFFERINNDSTASERGIYRLIRNKNKKNEQTYYGQFHVILRMENNDWKIFMDYDSNPDNRIGEKDYLESIPLDNYKEFIKDE